MGNIFRKPLKTLEINSSKSEESLSKIVESIPKENLKNKSILKQTQNEIENDKSQKKKITFDSSVSFEEKPKILNIREKRNLINYYAKIKNQIKNRLVHIDYEFNIQKRILEEQYQIKLNELIKKHQKEFQLKKQKIFDEFKKNLQKTFDEKNQEKYYYLNSYKKEEFEIICRLNLEKKSN
jgi:hypothetical protein